MTTRPAVLITGCSSGVGEAAARRFLRAGHPVYATARNVGALAALQEEGAVTLPLDLTEKDTMVAAVKRVESDHGAVGILINNAAYGIQGATERVDIDDARRLFETNFFGLATLTQLVLPAMRARRSGRIVNVASMGGHFSLPGAGYLHASKYAVEAFSDALRLEVRGLGVTVVIVEPGPILTPFPDKINETIPGPDGGVYDRFHVDLETRVSAAYKPKAVSFALSADHVAKAVERAALRSRPRARYPVGAMARGLIALRRLLPDAAMDAITRNQFRCPEN
ncbi:MAG TPA: SDR family NAD(P)-dependent oxidoreductase [Actinocrinis sp.]|jgi:short-subunit dehydrogenase